MPPLREAPRSYYIDVSPANAGDFNAELFNLRCRANDGDFDVWAAETRNDRQFLVFSEKNELPEVALNALMAEIGDSITAARIDHANMRKEKVAKLLGRVLGHGREEIRIR